MNTKNNSALFITGTVHEKIVTLGDNKKHTLYFREVSNIVLRKFALLERSNDDESRARSMAFLVAESLCEKDGSTAITVEQAARLKPNIITQCFSHALDVNSFGGEEKKTLPPKAGSGSGTS